MSDLGSLIALPRDEDAFKVYTDMNLWTEVRRYVLVEQHSKRSACVKFGIHEKTLHKMLEHPAPPGYRKPKVPRAKKIDKVLPVLHAWLEADRHEPPKQHHTAQRLFERMRDEHGFDGQITVVKDAVRAWKRVHREAYVPLSHPLGKAQVDFGVAHVDLDGERVKVCLFVMSLPPRKFPKVVSLFSGRTRGSARKRFTTGTSRRSRSSAACRVGSATTTRGSR